MMAAAPTEIGRCKCPICESKAARLRVSAKQLAYVTCNACNQQTFARSDRSDTLLRALHLPEPAEPAPPAAAPALVEPPAAPTPAAPPRAPAPKPTPAPEPAAPPPRIGWGLLGA